jgi:uncharacterized membrane protein
MSLPTQADLFTLKYAGLDGVFCDVAPSASVNTATMAYVSLGGVFFAGGATGGGGGGPGGSASQMFSIN